MGFRFRKTIKLGPVNVNLSKSGVGYSVGGKGLRVTKKADGGTRTTVSVPGTGISHVTETSGKKAGANSGKRPKKKTTIWGSVIAILVLICAISACSGGGEESQDEAQPQETVEETLPAEPEAAQEDVESQDVSQDTPEAQEPIQETQEDADTSSEGTQAGQDAPETQQPQETGAAAQEAPETQEQPQANEPEPEPQESEPQAVVPDPAPVVTTEPDPEPEPEPQPSTNDRTVYVTETGKRYHYDNNCNGGTYYESTLQAALNRGLTPCQKCAGG